MKINICFVTDDNYAMPTCVAASSIQRLASRGTRYDCYVLCKNVSSKKIDKFMQLCNSYFKVKLIELDDRYDFSKYRIDGIPATSTSIYKFFIPNILKSIERVIYLDGDIIVRKDLTELYNTDLGKNYIGAVKDNSGLDYKDLDGRGYSYINSGMMLMDLEKMRQDEVPEKLFEYRRTGYNKLMDQDAFNYVLRDKTMRLLFKYNTQTNALSRTFENKPEYTLDRIKKYWRLDDDMLLEDVFDDATILHFATAKPWKYYDGYGNDLWLYYYLTSPYADDGIVRTSRYIKEVSYSTTFCVGKAILKPLVSLKKFLFRSDSERKNFLKNFIS